MIHRAAMTLFALALSSSLPAAETLTIDHAAVACVAAESYPQFEARFTPAESVAKARVLFQPPGTAHWYAVAMRSEGPAFHGILPKPKKELETFRYYIEVTDRAAGTTRTPDQTARVVGSAMECEGRLMAGSLGSAAVTLQVPAGAPAIPSGFGSSGVTVAAAGAVAGAAAGASAASAGGGFPTALVIGAAGAAAAGGAVAVAKGSGEPSARTYSGAFNGEYTLTGFCGGAAGGGNTCTRVFAVSGTATVTLEEESNGSVKDVSGLQLNGTQTETRITGRCNPLGTSQLSRFCRLSGPAGALTCRQEVETATRGSAKQVFEFSGALGGGALMGNVRLDDSSQNVDPNCATSNSTGSAQFPLNLR